MTDTQTTEQQRAQTELEARLKDLEEENELLLLQLHQVQEELEVYFLRCQELEKGGGGSGPGASSGAGWVDDELPALQAEVSRLATLVQTQARMHEIASKNALNARLGDILVQSVSSSGSLVGLPGRLLKIWRASTADQPPARLGGKNFDKVIETFQAGGLEPVSQLLAAEPAPEMRAKAWTALARQQMKNGLFADAALSARRAHEEDPKPYRLKWLAFRLHDAGEIAEADACLSLLPQDTPFSDSEGRQRDQVRYEAKNARLREAKHKTGFDSRRQAMENQMQALRQERDRQARLAAERELSVTSLQQAQARLEQEKSALAGRLDAAERQARELDQARADSVKLVAEREEENRLLLAQLQQVQEELERHFQIVQELGKSHTRLEQEKSALVEKQEDCTKLLVIRQGEIESLQQTIAQREREVAVLAEQHQQVVTHLAARQAEVDTLLQDANRVEKDRAALKDSIWELTGQRDEQFKLAEGRLRQIEELQRKVQESEAMESELATRQEMIREEMARAEAQFDLLKEILLKEPRL